MRLGKNQKAIVETMRVIGQPVAPMSLFLKTPTMGINKFLDARNRLIDRGILRYNSSGLIYLSIRG